MPPARFTTGSTLRHVVVMAATGAVGLVAIFAVDLLNLFYLSLLGDRAIAAAIGFAGVVGFFQTSLCIGLMIGLGAMVSRSIGAGHAAEARRLAASGLLLIAIVTAVTGLATALAAAPLLDRLGATGETHAIAVRFLTITAPSLPLLALGMGLTTVLRAVGDARGAMNLTLLAALSAACLDPLLIFALHLGVPGAALATVVSRLILAGVSWRSAVLRRGLVGHVAPASLGPDIRVILTVAAPAILTNLATPVGSAWVTRSMAEFGPAAVAGLATIDRIAPVAFAMVYALSGAVGPILAQNFGAGRPDRVRAALRDSLAFTVVAVLCSWAVLALAEGLVLRAFSAEGVTADLVRLFCSVLAGSFVFAGLLFVANAAFNNLGHPLLSTLFNWGRATLGTIPFVAFGAQWGPQGVLIGQALGSVAFGLAAVAVAFRVLPRVRAVPADNLVPAHPAMTGVAVLATLLERPWRPWRWPDGR